MLGKMIKGFLFLILVFTIASCTKESKENKTRTVALWLFDEPTGLYPSSVMDDSSPNDYPLTLGLAGKLVKGKFGNALEVITKREIKVPAGEVRFGLKQLPIPKGRTVEPLSWMNADFTALMTKGENYLRKEVGYPNVTDTKLNLGNFNWTVEFWFSPQKKLEENGVVFEIGSGPRGEKNNTVTRMSVDKNLNSFVLFNSPSKLSLKIKTLKDALNPGTKKWHHFAFVYSARKKGLFHYVDGKLVLKYENVSIKSLPHGDEAYMSLGKDGMWKEPLSGKLDELRFSEGMVYKGDFKTPVSLVKKHKPYNLVEGLPLLFDKGHKDKTPLLLGGRKHLFIDDAFIQRMKNSTFNINPPKKAERVIDNIKGEFRKHLTVVQDGKGIIRIYNSGPKDYLQVFVSKDGVHFTQPNVGHGVIEGKKNIVIPENVGGLGNPFIDPNAPPNEKWKYISGYHRRGIYIFTSPDGYNWTRHVPAFLPFRSGTQSCSFYDDQQQEYITYHRSGIFHTPGGATQRSSVVVTAKDLFTPVNYKALTQKDYFTLAKKYPLRQPLPWYLDNGPLTPGGFGMEFPHKFDPIPADPVGTDIYVTKALKYKWAPDTYLAFPIVYFHYDKDGPVTRQILGTPSWQRGSGPIETQLETSRDGLNWKRYPRPAYVGMGKYLGRNIYQIYIADGMIRRGDEIWQYFYGNTEYHSAWKKNRQGQAVYRLVQRLDGFVSIDSPYGKEGYIVTKPFVFEGNRLVLNIYTGATGYAQVGFLNEKGKPIKGFSVDDGVYINGDFVRTNVQWIKNRDEVKNINFSSKNIGELRKNVNRIIVSADVSKLQGKVVQLVFRMRGAKLYSMQFKKVGNNQQYFKR